MSVLCLIFLSTLLAVRSVVHEAISDDIMGLLSRFAVIFSFSSLAGTLVSLFLKPFIPQFSQVISTWFIITKFIPTYAPLASLLAMVINMLPLPGPVLIGLTSAMYSFIAFAILYYLAAKVGAVPV